MRLLLIEDNVRLAGLIVQALEREMFTIDSVTGIEDARAALDVASYDALILDLGLPDGDGLDMLRRLRSARDPVPVLILSARERLDDRLVGLNAGADDYLAKPFAMQELSARLRAILRRPAAMAPASHALGNLSMDDAAHQVDVDGRRLDLPRRERAVLRLLLRNKGRLVPRQAIDNAVFGFDSEVGSNALEVYVSRLRKRLQQAGADVVIKTEKGIGYILTWGGGDGQ
ncbi:response regulator transcription factor [Magnetospirillum sp. 15-1]|uniref:response regulator transcription factor n=1 Tax=Magnetospirillum sp. 15-1 TaxID=1979370 RepID=UPI000BBCDECD|nr:response regulator transcription factor [Magnetospirillum sp. 15-1]